MNYLFLITAILVQAIMLQACAPYGATPQTYDRIQPRSSAEVAFAKSVLQSAQTISFRHNVEYCGYIGVDETGELIQSALTRGQESYCEAVKPSHNFNALASFHTHGGFSDDHDSETPSADDLKADIAEGLDGYISTPGGRFWYSNAKAKRVVLLCGEACLLQDPHYEAFGDSIIETDYTLDELIELDF